MSDIRELFVTIDTINRDMKIKKYEGDGHYIATVIEGTTLDGGEFKKNLSNELLDKVPSLASQVSSLSEGELVKIVSEKKGKYNNIKSIFKKGDIGFDIVQATGTTSAPTTTGQGGSGYNVQGQIKGNAVTNGVNMAIAQGLFTEEAILENALKVLNVHKQLEGMDLTKTETGSLDEEVKSAAASF